jgi:hypothetical protein
MGAVEPYLTGVAQRIERNGRYLILARGSHQVRIFVGVDPPSLTRTVVALVPTLRALGDRVEVDASRGQIGVTTPAPYIGFPTPFDSRVPEVGATVVFTPTPAPTPALIWTGTPVPRRTPIPLQAWATPKPPA